MERKSLTGKGPQSGKKSPDLRFLHNPAQHPPEEHTNTSSAALDNKQDTGSSGTESTDMATLIRKYWEIQRLQGMEANRRIEKDVMQHLDQMGVAKDSMIIPEGLKKTEERVDEEIRYSWGDSLDGRSGGATQGHHHPNEDACFAQPDISAFGVFDGLGGKEESHIAARFTSNHFQTALMEFGNGMSPEEACEKMKEILAGAEQELRERYPRTNTATTVSVFKSIEYQGKLFGIVLNVGDSRIYRFSASNKLEHKTNDYGKKDEWHKTIQEQIASFEDFKNVPEYLKGYVEQRHIVEDCLNSYSKKEGVKPYLDYFEIEPGDMILLTSDGVHDNLTDNKIVSSIEGKKPAESAISLVKEAYTKSIERTYGDHTLRSKRDDITALAIGY